MPDVLLIQGSLRERSRTAIAIREAAAELKKRKISHEIIDLRKVKMPFCDGRDILQYPPAVRKIYKKIEESKALIFGMPVYCYSLSGVLKNFIDITAEAMEDKVAGILCNAGGSKSYLASADLMKILSFESNCSTVQPTVYSASADFDGDHISNPKVHEKLEKMVDAICVEIGHVH